MSVRSTIFITLVILILQGCTATSERSLMQKRNSQSFCHNESLSETIALLEPQLARCYAKNNSLPIITHDAYTSIPLNNDIIKRLENNGSIVYIHTIEAPLNPTAYGFRLHVQKGDHYSCPTMVTTHVMNNAWRRHIKRIKLWLSREDMRCQFW